ncbi:hypothetical protein [Herbaspirillum huttiense]|uniref:hypothetical protein n=1 Tax=Herbaspirillum huttiense TaxID=863372 RepID=UPI0005846F3E|nr:hypothetical protein [Herbaspirillum huttiense]
MSNDIEQVPRTRSIFDTTINVQTLCAALIGAAIAVIVGWFQLVGEVRELKIEVRNNKIEGDARATRIEQSQQQDRADNKEQWRLANEKLDKIRDMMIQNSTGARPEIKRWMK